MLQISRAHFETKFKTFTVGGTKFMSSKSKERSSKVHNFNVTISHGHFEIMPLVGNIFSPITTISALSLSLSCLPFDSTGVGYEATIPFPFTLIKNTSIQTDYMKNMNRKISLTMICFSVIIFLCQFFFKFSLPLSTLPSYLSFLFVISIITYTAKSSVSLKD